MKRGKHPNSQKNLKPFEPGEERAKMSPGRPRTTAEEIALKSANKELLFQLVQSGEYGATLRKAFLTQARSGQVSVAKFLHESVFGKPALRIEMEPPTLYEIDFVLPDGEVFSRGGMMSDGSKIPEAKQIEYDAIDKKMRGKRDE